jgi:hypothetical protein
VCFVLTTNEKSKRYNTEPIIYSFNINVNRSYYRHNRKLGWEEWKEGKEVYAVIV